MNARLMKHSCSVRRDAAVGTNGRRAKQVVATGVRCLFLPMPSRAEIENEFSVGTGYDVYFDIDSDIKTGDQLLWGNQTYNVRAAREYVLKRVGHIHVLATREGV